MRVCSFAYFVQEEADQRTRLARLAPSLNADAMTYPEVKAALKRLAVPRKPAAPASSSSGVSKGGEPWRPEPRKVEKFGKVTSRAKALEAIERIVSNTPNNSISFADFGVKFSALTGGPWAGETKAALGNLRQFLLTCPGYVVENDVIKKAVGYTSDHVHDDDSDDSSNVPVRPKSSAAAGAAVKRGNKASLARAPYDTDDAADAVKNQRGCAPGSGNGGGQGSCCGGLGQALALVSAFVLTAAVMAAVLHWDVIPGAAQHPVLGEWKQMVDAIIKDATAMNNQ